MTASPPAPPKPVAPKPEARPDRVSLWRYLRLFRKDILSAQPARLYRAWMAEFRAPFLRSFLCNDPALVARVLRETPGDFPKSERLAEGLRPLLGNSLFLSSGPDWEAQRRLIDPAFAGGRLADTLPGIWSAAQETLFRLNMNNGHQSIDIEYEMSRFTADAIFRTLFSIPISDQTAQAVFEAFRTHQRAQPILNLAALLPLPRAFPRLHSRSVRRSARQIRSLIEDLVRDRSEALAQGRAPDDLASKIMTARDPETGRSFDTGEMVDQVAIFFLAGHETSAATLGWALYLLALAPDWQEKIAAEAAGLPRGAPPGLTQIGRLTASRAVLRETLRLYPPVPMMVRESRCPVRFRDRDLSPGDQVVISPWHLHRHERLWPDPDLFDPGRWHRAQTRDIARKAYLPFSAGPRVCPGAGFAMAEAALLLAMVLRDFRLETVPGDIPVPVAHLTVRARNGIRLHLIPRESARDRGRPDQAFG